MVVFIYPPPYNPAGPYVRAMPRGQYSILMIILLDPVMDGLRSDAKISRKLGDVTLVLVSEINEINLARIL